MSAGRVLFTFTESQSILFVRRFADFLRKRGWRVGVACGDGPELKEAARGGMDVFPLPWSRTSSLHRDMLALREFRKVLLKYSPDILHASTVKAGALSMLASIRTQPRRLYHMRGLPLETASGVTRLQLWAAESTACSLADEVVCVSSSLLDRAREVGVRGLDKAVVLGHGSGQGVDTDRFDRHRVTTGATSLRLRFGIAEHACVFGYVGRFAIDKGMGELAAAWPVVSEVAPHAHLLLIGNEDGRQNAYENLAALRGLPRVHVLPWQDDMVTVYRAMDVMVLPSYREGLPNVLLEAGSMELASVTARVTGCTDVVDDDQNGILVPPRNVEALARGMIRYAQDPGLVRRHGQEARRRVQNRFEQGNVWQNMESFYVSMLHARSTGASRS